MKITRKQLQRVIKEEVQRHLSETYYTGWLDPAFDPDADTRAHEKEGENLSERAQAIVNFVKAFDSLGSPPMDAEPMEWYKARALKIAHESGLPDEDGLAMMSMIQSKAHRE